MHHKGQLGISGDADDSDTLEFTDSRGRAIRRSGAKPTPPTNAPAPITGTYERPLGERLDHRWVTFSNPADWPHRTWRPDDRTA